MGQASFGGITFDWLLPGFSEDRAALVTVRTPPGAEVTYVDRAGAGPRVWRADLKFATLADYENLRDNVGAFTELSYAAGEAPVWAVLQSLSRYWRRGTGPQLAHSEWTVFPE